MRARTTIFRLIRAELKCSPVGTRARRHTSARWGYPTRLQGYNATSPVGDLFAILKRGGEDESGDR
jgi:hypothetical protein